MQQSNFSYARQSKTEDLSGNCGQCECICHLGVDSMDGHTLSIFRMTRYGRRKRLGKTWALIPLLLIAVAGTAKASPPSADEGKAISGMCATCHGDNGIAVDSSYPNLAGQNYQYLVKAIERFKNGQRPNDVMHSMTIGLSEKQVRDLAAYFSSIHSVTCKKK
jgi:cytochrome c553